MTNCGFEARVALTSCANSTTNIYLSLGDIVMATTDERAHVTRDVCSTVRYLLFQVGDDQRRELAAGGIAILHAICDH